jgi:membrane-bound serine protease (ClpP class)
LQKNSISLSGSLFHYKFKTMTRLFLPIYLLLLFFLPALLSSQQVQADGKIWVLEIDGAIGPATSDYFTRSLKEAATENVTLIVLRINTPGGLDIAMRDMIQAIIASPIPIASYVAPSGARAASAGTYILYASHIAAMAPGTNLGAATPVQIGGIELPGGSDKEDKDSKDKKTPSSSEETMTHKIINDAEAYLRSLAQLRGRNVDWASAAVRESASLSAEDALKKGVVDLIATDLHDLLERLHGRDVKVQDKTRQLVTKGVVIEMRQPNWRTQFLSVITDPNIAYLLMLLGIYGLFFELYNPGSVVPGVVGGIALLMALLAFQALPINYAGLALILLGLAFMIAEAFLPSFGVVGIGGIIAFALGSVILIDNGVLPSDEVSFSISRSLIAGVTLTTAAFFFLIIHLLVKTRSRPVVSGREHLMGAEGECLSNESGKLRVYVQSELWNAQASTPIAPGQQVRVMGMNGLTLKVAVIERSD